ncbi:MAG: ABC transporter permease [Vicinamibacteria bacterium]|nr:ABC transporter permease [Vicinamibacteria bacterium]
MTRSALRALIRRAVVSLRAHALRSALSILGILFGVASITAMSSVTEGARLEALSQIGDLGADTLVIRARPASEKEMRPALTIDDSDRLASALPGVRTIAPIRGASLELPGPLGPVPATIVGTSETYAQAARSSLALGRHLTPLDVADRRRVAVLGAEIALELFPAGTPLGQRVRIGDDVFDVIGVLEPRASRRSSRGSAPLLGRDLNRSVIVPWNCIPGPGSEVSIGEVLIRLNRSADARALAAAARRTVERSLGRDGAEVIVPLEVLRQQQKTQTVFGAVTGATSLICLLVGGVGIMNILLASVSERVREIGIRRAVGATREDIAAQFLAEGALLSACGGGLGLVLGGGAALLIQHWASWPIAAAPGLVFLGFLSSVLTGVAAGGYPAWTAAHLEVMDALRRG